MDKKRADRTGMTLAKFFDVWGSLLTFAVLIAVFCLLSGSFRTGTNLINILTQSAPTLICHLLPPLETSSYSTRPPGIRGPCVVSVALFTQKRLPGVENRSSRFAWMKSYLPCFTRWISPRS